MKLKLYQYIYQRFFKCNYRLIDFFDNNIVNYEPVRLKHTALIRVIWDMQCFSFDLRQDENVFKYHKIYNHLRRN